MHAESSVLIRASLGDVYEVVSSVERWPELFPHYRAVRVRTEVGRRRLVEMAARSGWIPMSYLAIQESHPDVPEIAFYHVRGLTRGMAVAWRFEARPNGVWVTIQHELRPSGPGMARLVVDRVVAPLFVQLVADQTLARVKELAEARRAARRLQLARRLSPSQAGVDRLG
jgi:ribosome-associated toxin RatA of RatAB toxin-antitoxin module